MFNCVIHHCLNSEHAFKNYGRVFGHFTLSTATASVLVQYRHLIPAPVDRTPASAWLYKHQWLTCQKNKPNLSMTHEACESKLRSVVRSSMHPYRVEIGRAVVYYAWAAREFSAGIKCRHCMRQLCSSSRSKVMPQLR